MTKRRTDTRERILAAAYRLFYAQGFSRVSVDAIAERAGVTKRTVYYHFTSKDDVIAEVLNVQHQHLMRQYGSWLPEPTQRAEDVLCGVFAKLKEWAEGPVWLGSGFTRASMELADMRGHPVHAAASHHKASVETWLAEQLATAGVGQATKLAKEVMLLIEGSMSLALVHGDRSYFQAAEAAACRLVAGAKV